MRIIYNASKSRSAFTEAMKEYTEKKLSGVAKQLKEDEPVKISLEMIPKGEKPLILKCQMVTADNKRIRAEVASSGDYYNAVDDLRNKVNGLIRKNKRDKSFVSRVHDEPEYRNDASEIRKTKQVVMESISADEAIRQADELGHSWFVFKNSDDNDSVCVVYKRFEGDYGIIVCK